MVSTTTIHTTNISFFNYYPDYLSECHLNPYRCFLLVFLIGVATFTGPFLSRGPAWPSTKEPSALTFPPLAAEVVGDLEATTGSEGFHGDSGFWHRRSYIAHYSPL